MNLKIAVIEDDPLRLIGLRSILEEVSGFHLAAMSVAELAVERTVDLVLLGIGSGTKGFETLAHIRTARREVPVLVTGTNATEEIIVRALGYGAKGYVDEAAPATHLAEAIGAVHRGLIWAPRRVLSTFIERSLEISGRNVRPGESRLTAREKQVLQMLVEGRSNKEIGGPLGIEERTVKAHISKLMRKVGVKNRIQLSVRAFSHTLLS